MKQRMLCRMSFRYGLNDFYCFPLLSNEKLFLGIEEDDFLLDGYSIRRYADLTKLQTKDDKCLEILKREGIIDQITTPDVDISSWEAVFTSLQKLHRNIIVERENLKEEERLFVIGRIERVFRKFAYVRYFDPNGVWEDEPDKILYTQITSVSFGTRYVDIFSKYLEDWQT
jgi:hypothetical protein